jgi:hypothetical protein
MSPQTNNALSFGKRVLLFILVGVGSILLIRPIYALGPKSQEPLAQERKLKTKDFKDMPVILVAVRNLQSETWYEDLQIVLKNISSKPIYFLTAYLVFPDKKLDWGEAGVHLSWGDSKKLNHQKFAEADAQHVEPGKGFVVTIPKMYMRGLRTQERLSPHTTKNLLLRFEKTYFGDGTGFEAESLTIDDLKRKPE